MIVLKLDDDLFPSSCTILHFELCNGGRKNFRPRGKNTRDQIKKWPDVGSCWSQLTRSEDNLAQRLEYLLCRLSQSDDKDKVDVNKIHSTGEVVDKVSDKLRLLSLITRRPYTLGLHLQQANGFSWQAKLHSIIGFQEVFFVPHLMDEVDENSQLS